MITISNVFYTQTESKKEFLDDDNRPIVAILAAAAVNSGLLLFLLFEHVAVTAVVGLWRRVCAVIPAPPPLHMPRATLWYHATRLNSYQTVMKDYYSTRIRRMRKVIFSVCSHLRWGPHTANGGTPSFPMGVPHPSWWEVLLSFLVEDTPFPGLDEGVPHLACPIRTG